MDGIEWAAVVDGGYDPAGPALTVALARTVSEAWLRGTRVRC